MLKLNVNQEKQLTFEVQIGGVQTEQVSSYLRIEIDKVEYGFPAVVGRESITVNLPPLRSVTARSLKEGEEVQVKLDIIADGNYLTPWQDTFRLGNPLVIEAKIVDKDFNEPIAFRTKLVTEGKPGKSKQGLRLETVEEDQIDQEAALTDKIVNKLSEKFNNIIKSKNKKKVVEESCGKDHVKEQDEDVDDDENPDTVPPMEDQEEEVRESDPLSGGAMERILSQTISKLGLYTEDKKKKSKKEMTLEQFKKKLTKEDVYKYMKRAGTKNPKIQEIVYEQAVIAAKTNAPVEVLRQVITIMKKNKS